jgi:hypothetical protein
MRLASTWIRVEPTTPASTAVAHYLRLPRAPAISIYGNNWIMIWLIMKSATRINRDDVTTA